MGLPMQNIHAPTIEAGPTSQVQHSDIGNTSRLSLEELIAKKGGVEAELTALGAVLESVS